MLIPLLNIILLSLIGHVVADATVNVPDAPSTSHVVDSDFLGISIELSFVDQYSKWFLRSPFRYWYLTLLH